MMSQVLMANINILASAILLLVLLPSTFSSDNYYTQAQGQMSTNSSNKIVIITFGDGWKTQYTAAKPILDKYGFKASFFVTCNFVGLPARMDWQEILALYHDGNDIGSKTTTYKDLT